MVIPTTWMLGSLGIDAEKTGETARLLNHGDMNIMKKWFRLAELLGGTLHSATVNRERDGVCHVLYVHRGNREMNTLVHTDIYQFGRAEVAVLVMTAGQIFGGRGTVVDADYALTP